jgi:hypothetical protein
MALRAISDLRSGDNFRDLEHRYAENAAHFACAAV